jgi:hypothetical protein
MTASGKQTTTKENPMPNKVLERKMVLRYKECEEMGGNPREIRVSRIVRTVLCNRRISTSISDRSRVVQAKARAISLPPVPGGACTSKTSNSNPHQIGFAMCFQLRWR